MASILEVQTDRQTDRQLISIEDTFPWLSRGDLTSETEREIIAAQDQALQTKYHAETETDSQCRLCQKFDEKMEHIISACPILATEQYIKRHDRACAQPH
jgi:hypothetical protein